MNIAQNARAPIILIRHATVKIQPRGRGLTLEEIEEGAVGAETEDPPPEAEGGLQGGAIGHQPQRERRENQHIHQ